MNRAESSTNLTEIGWFRALVVFPLVLIPWNILRAVGLALWYVARKARGAWNERDREPAPPRPMGVVFSAAAILMALAVSAIVSYAHDWHDRLESSGLLLITMATLLVSPELLDVDALRKVDEWWEHSTFPPHQLAFAFHARRAGRIARRVGLGGAAFVLIATLIVAATSRILPTTRHTISAATPAAAWLFVSLFLLGATGVLLRLWLGQPAVAAPQPITVPEAERLLASPASRVVVRRWAVALFAMGTTLSFIATTFLPPTPGTPN